MNHNNHIQQVKNIRQNCLLLILLFLTLNYVYCGNEIKYENLKSVYSDTIPYVDMNKNTDYTLSVILCESFRYIVFFGCKELNQKKLQCYMEYNSLTHSCDDSSAKNCDNNRMIDCYTKDYTTWNCFDSY